MAGHPQHPRHLLDSKWTAVTCAHRERHWQVTRFDDASGEVELLAVLTGRTRRLAWRSLRDREVWLPGWVRAADRPSG